MCLFHYIHEGLRTRVYQEAFPTNCGLDDTGCCCEFMTTLMPQYNSPWGPKNSTTLYVRPCYNEGSFLPDINNPFHMVATVYQFTVHSTSPNVL